MLKTQGTPKVRKSVIAMLLGHYQQNGIIQSWNLIDGKYVLVAPTGETFIYGLMGIEAWIAGLQTFAVRLGLGPLNIQQMDPKPGTCEDDFCESAMKAAMWEFEYDELKKKYDALLAERQSSAPF